MAEKEIGKLYTTIEVRGTKQVENDLKKLEQNANKEAKKIQDDFKKNKINLDTKLGQMSIKDLTKEYRTFEKAFQKDIKFGLPQSELAQTRKELDLIKQKLSDVGVNAEKTGFSFKNMAGALIATGVILKGLQVLKTFIVDSIMVAAKLEGIKTGFDKLNDPSLLSNLRTATRNTVSDIDLMQKALQGKNFGIAGDLLAKGLEFANIRAIQTGQSVDYLVESFVTGLGRKSIKILDNLQINIAEFQQEVKKTGDYATAMGNILDRELKKAGKVASTTATSIAQIGAALDNVSAKAGNALIRFADWVSTGIFGQNAGKTLDLVSKGIDYILEGSKQVDIVAGSWMKKFEKMSKVDIGLTLVTNEQSLKKFEADYAKALSTKNVAVQYATKQEELDALKSQIATAKGIQLGYEKWKEKNTNTPIIPKLTIDQLKESVATLKNEFEKAKLTGEVDTILKAKTAYEDEKAVLDNLLVVKENEIKLNNKLETELSKLIEQYNALASASSPEAQKLAAKIAGLQAEADATKKLKDDLLALEAVKLRMAGQTIKDLAGMKGEGVKPKEKFDWVYKFEKPIKFDAEPLKKVDVKDKYGVTPEEIIGINKELSETDNLLTSSLKNGANDFINVFSSGLSGLITKSMTLNDMLKNIGDTFLNTLISLGVKAGISALIPGAGAFLGLGNMQPTAPTVPTFGGTALSGSGGSNISMSKLEQKLDRLIQVNLNGNQILALKDMNVNIRGGSGIEYAKQITRTQDELTRAGFKA